MKLSQSGLHFTTIGRGKKWHIFRFDRDYSYCVCGPPNRIAGARILAVPDELICRSCMIAYNSQGLDLS